MTLETLKSFPANCQPLHHDFYHMGTPIASNVMILHATHPSEKAKYIIIVNTETGERVKIHIN